MAIILNVDVILFISVNDSCMRLTNQQPEKMLCGFTGLGPIRNTLVVITLVRWCIITDEETTGRFYVTILLREKNHNNIALYNINKFVYKILSNIISLSYKMKFPLQ